MPNEEENIEKKYYSIGEVAKMLHVSTSLIRFWENTFKSLKPKKNKKGVRRYTKADINHFRLIYHLVKEQGYTLQGANQVLQNNKHTLKGSHVFVEALKNIKTLLITLRDQLGKNE
ncbi:MAG: MerR family transcriptional regulator [Cytophagales bacterium]|nr:MerR family transcriptional regulator [Cytophagales bacterium]